MPVDDLVDHIAVVGHRFSSPRRPGEGLRAALKPHWRGGVFGEIVEGGTIATGDAVYTAVQRFM
ncbi:MAG TPA: hypothetical protein VJZ76_10815 [Thermoanaerobaculia bacterium]|nr:hypothetical protein [Thermoanaerobaculia bacterium]